MSQRALPPLKAHVELFQSGAFFDSWAKRFLVIKGRQLLVYTDSLAECVLRIRLVRLPYLAGANLNVSHLKFSSFVVFRCACVSASIAVALCAQADVIKTGVAAKSEFHEFQVCVCCCSWLLLLFCVCF